MNPRELRELTVAELVGREEDLRSSIFKARFQNVLGNEKEASKIGSLRRDIARVKTILREKAED